jgi:hypothetical protein
MRTIRFLAFCLLLTLAAGQGAAELPLLGVDDLKKMSSHIVTGTVRKVYTAPDDKGEGYVDTLHLIEITVAKVEKGKDVTPKQVLYARTWKRDRRPVDFVGPSGQAFICKTGDQVRLFLRQNADGTFELLIPNGMHTLDGK